MVGPYRSLVTRFYLYAAVVLLLSSVAVFFIGRAMVDEGRIEAWRQLGEDQAAFVGREIEASYRGGAPSSARMDDLSNSLHVALQYTPWDARGRYPAELATTKILPVDSQGPGMRSHHFWVRLDSGGRPAGVLKVAFERPRPNSRPAPGWRLGPYRLPVVASLGWMALLALMIVPPLWLWVLRPLRRMEGVAHRLGHGDLATPVATDRRDEFGELERAFENLRQRVQQMLAARERLLRDISHELRGPLSRMAIALPLLRDDRQSPYLDQIERDMHAMDGLIGEILALARGRSPEALTPEPLDLADLAQGLLTERQLVIDQRRAPVTAQLASAPSTGDRRLLARAMGNFFDNALKYAPEAPIRLETATEDGHVVFRVVDQGPGIAAADLPHLFEPFYRPDTSRSRETGGTGLGLAIARAIAEAHRGQALLTAEKGRGTRAELRLPILPPTS